MQNVNGPPRSQQVQPGQAPEKAPGIPSHSQPGLHGQQDTKINQVVGGKDSLQPPGSSVSEVVSSGAAKAPQKGDNQLDDKTKPLSPEPATSKGAPGVDANSLSTTDSKQQAPADVKGAQHDTKEDKSEAKEDSAPPTQVTQSPSKVIPQSPASQLQQKAKPLQHNLQSQNASLMPQKETLPPMQPNQVPPQMPINQNPPLLQRNQGVLPLQPQPNQNPPQAHPGHIPPFQQKAPQMQALPHLQHQSQLHQLQPQLPRPGLHPLHHQLQHQSPNQKRALELQGQQMQEPLLPNAPQMTGLSRPRAPAQPQPGAAPYFPAPNQSLPNAPRQIPGEAPFGMPQFMNPRPAVFPDQRPPLSGQGGPGQQPQGFSQGILRDQPSQWRPGGAVGFPKEPQSPSRIPSPLTPSLLAGGPQRGYSDLPGQTFLPPPPQIDAAKSLSVDQSRHLMEQIAAFENETRSGKNFESDKFSGPRPEDPYLLEAQKRLNQRAMFRPEPHPGHRDGSPPRALEFGARFAPGGPLDMPSRAAPHPPLDMEIRARAGIPSDVAAGRELFPRPGFPPDVQGGREFPAEFGMSHRKAGDFGGQRNPLDDMGLRSSFPSDTAVHLKYPSDAFHRGRSPDFGPRSGPLSEIGSRRSPPRPPFQMDSDSRPKFHMDMDSRAPFQLDGDSRPKFSDFDSRPSMLLDNESRLKFSSDPDIPRPPFHLDNFRSRFPPENERPGLHLDADQRAKFSLDREPRPRFDSDVDSRRNFELRTGSSFEERSRPGFSTEIGLQSRFPHSDMIGGRPEGLGLPSDFLGPRGDSMRSRTDSISSMRSPGREPLSRRDGFGSGWREPFSLPGPFEPLHGGPPLHSGPDLARDNYRFEDPRVKGLDLHPNPLLHESLNPGRPFHHAGRGPYKGGPGFPHSFAGPRPPLGSLNGGPQFKTVSIVPCVFCCDFLSGWLDSVCHPSCRARLRMMLISLTLEGRGNKEEALVGVVFVILIATLCRGWRSTRSRKSTRRKPWTWS